MNIIEEQYKWHGLFAKRLQTKYIILHHRAGTGNAQTIHSQHLADGSIGIGYQFYVRRDGTVYRGRPIDAVGAHTKNYNSVSIGVCFEGNYQSNNNMPLEQIEAGRELIAYLKELYPGAEVKKHNDFASTACPGKYFKFEEIKKGVDKMSVQEAIEILKGKVGLEEQTVDFLLCYKYGEELVLKLAKVMK